MGWTPGAGRCLADESALLSVAPQRAVTWRYSVEKPVDDWSQADFDDSSWSRGPAGFGTRQTPGTEVGTTWRTSDIWLRTQFDYDGSRFEKAALDLYHDEDVTVWLNGEPILKRSWYVPHYELHDVTAALKKAIRPGRNVLAVTCHQTAGGQYVDVGIVLDPERESPRPVKLPPLKPLFDVPVRDTSICLGPDGCYYLTGTTGNNAGDGGDPKSWWYVNEGIRVWKSPDLKQWQPLGLVWKIEEGTWQKQKHGNQRALWAPDIHYLKGTFWLTFCMNFGGTGLLKSASGKAEGPYVDVSPEKPIAGKIDASLFQDDDGMVYFVWQNGLIARMNADMTELAEKPRMLKPANHHQVGFEGAYVAKRDGTYCLICADFVQGNYHCMVATSDHVYGPYGPRYLAVPHGGHNMSFTDNAGTISVDTAAAAQALGVAAGGIVIHSGRSLTIGAEASFAEGTTLELGQDAMFSAGGGSIPAVVTTGSATLGASGSLDVARVNAGPGRLTKQGTGTLRLKEGAVTAGPAVVFQVEEGRLAAAGEIPLDEATQVILAGGTLSVRGGFVVSHSAASDPLIHYSFDAITDGVAENLGVGGADFNGVLSGPVTADDGMIGGALDFGGGKVVTANQVPMAEEYTVSLWLNSAAPQPLPWARIVLNHSHEAGSYLGGNAANSQYQMIVAGNADVVGGEINNNPDVWQHVVATHDGTAASLYVNGELVAGPVDMPGPVAPTSTACCPAP